MVQIGKWFANFMLFARMMDFLVIWGCTWIFNCWYVNEWHRFCIIHNLKYKNTIVSQITMRVNGKTVCILLPVLEAVST